MASIPVARAGVYLIHVNSDDLPIGTDLFGCKECVEAGTAAKIDDRLSL